MANAGSSSVKLSLLDGDDTELWRRELDAPRSVVEPAAVAQALAELPEAPDAVGHRIVHGGERFRSAVRLDAEVLSALRDLTVLAPLHQPKSLAAVEAVSQALPDVPEVACFDTAFHASLPPAAATYALPREWRERYRVRRFGFHGLSHAYAAGRVLNSHRTLIGSSPATSAPERLCVRCSTDARSTRRWGSRRSRAW